jgi:hypothetical protein
VTNGTLLFEVRPAGGDGWVTLGILIPEDPEGSISSMTGDGGRDILLFRCEGVRSVVSRSVGGLDFTDGPDRIVVPLGGREILADLGAGQSYERDVTSDALREYRARWTHRG